jgi:unsaturated rhamnogalacturonyl hydrolase
VQVEDLPTSVRRDWARATQHTRLALPLLFALVVSGCEGSLTGGAGGSREDAAATGGQAGTSIQGGSGGSGGKVGTGGTTGPGGTTKSRGTTGSGGVANASGATGVGGSGKGGVAGSGGISTGHGGTASDGGIASGGNGGKDAGLGTGGGKDASLAMDSVDGNGGQDAGSSICPKVSDFDSWTNGKGPLDIGKLAAKEFESHTGETYGGAGYALALSWYGSLRFNLTTGNQQNNKALIDAFEPYASGAKKVEDKAMVDYRVFGALPFEIYLENQDARCKALGLARADGQWTNLNSEGITSDARYWSDDMYMITALQVQAYRATKDAKYLDRAAKAMLVYHDKLQRTNGLFWHSLQATQHWGRANGWVASGMTELLLELPAGPTRDSVMKGFKSQMDGLLAVQITSGSDEGCWRQLLDVTAAQAESSCTAMFTYALATAVKNGWLTDPKYAAAARKGWIALANKTNSKGQLDKVCPSTGEAPAGDAASQQQYYLKIAFKLGDLHGQAPLIWAATTLLRTDCPGLR